MMPIHSRPPFLAVVTKLIFVALLAIGLSAGPAFAHDAHHGGGGKASHMNGVGALAGPMTPASDHHRHDGSGSFHCMVSVSCAPVFTLASGWDGVLSSSVALAWHVADEARRLSLVTQRDPPVPRA